MEQLRFSAVHEDGQHLVLSSPDGAELLLPIDARLRSALRTRSAPADAPATPLSPRDVQAMIRAGQSPEEVAEITGWPAERVARFEGPILAEREHVSGMAQAAHVRGRAPEGGIPTLGSRVLERLAERGVDTDNVGWDATRPEGGSWTVVVSFVAGQRRRAAAWRFDPADRTVEALDDEARWLSEDEQALPGSAAGRALLGGGASEEVDLMTSMRERSRSRGRRRKTSTSKSDPAGLPQLEHAPEDVLPLEDLAYDPDTMGLPPAAHGEPPAPGAAAELPSPDDAPADDDAPAEDASTDTSAVVAPGPDEAVDPADGTTSYDVELEFDDEGDEDAIEFDDEDAAVREPAEAHAHPAPQDTTLADLFDADETDLEEAVETEVGDEPVAEDAVELGGDLEEAEDATDDVEPASSDAAEEPEVAQETAPAKKPAKRKDGRPGVPSWDDIMFGAKDRRG